MPPLLGPGAPSNPPVPTKYRTCTHTQRCLCVACTYNIHVHHAPWCVKALFVSFPSHLGFGVELAQPHLPSQADFVLTERLCWKQALPWAGEKGRGQVFFPFIFPSHTPATGRWAITASMSHPSGAVYSARCNLGVLIPLKVGVDQQNIISWHTTNCLASCSETEYSYLLKSIKPKWPHPLWTPGQCPMTHAQHTSHI